MQMMNTKTFLVAKVVWR